MHRAAPLPSRTYNARMRAWMLMLFVALLAAAPGAQGELTVSIDARAVRPGDVVVITARATAPADAVQLHLFGRVVEASPLDPLTWTALAGVDLGVAPGVHAVTIEARGRDGMRQAAASLTVEPGRFTTRRLRVDPAYVEPPADVVVRILSESARLDALWARGGARQWTGPFVAPVPGRPVGRFGARSIFNGQPRAPHAGEDYAQPHGTPIVAPGRGTIVLAEDLYFTGRTVVVDHGAGLLSLLAHLSSIEVHTGDLVEAGQRIGLVGATGRVTGAHLHWSVRLGTARVSPSSLLAALGTRAVEPARANPAPLPR